MTSCFGHRRHEGRVSDACWFERKEPVLGGLEVLQIIQIFKDLAERWTHPPRRAAHEQTEIRPESSLRSLRHLCHGNVL